MANHDLTAGVSLDTIGDEALVAGKRGDEDVVLIRRDGKWCALAGTCSHLGGPLAEGIVVDGTLRCPWHHARFSVETGEAVGAPAFAPLDRFAVLEEDGILRVGDRLDPVAPPPPPRDPGRVVIVGSGGAGYACADLLARHGLGRQVTVLSDDASAPYDRTFCSKFYLSGEEPRHNALLPTAGGGHGAPPTIRTGVTVASIDPAGRAVVLGDGERIAGDVLILATGAAPLLPDFTGADRDDVFRVRTLADAEALGSAAEGATAAIVVGSSFVGMEVAASLIQRGLMVTMVSDADLPFAAVLGPEVGREMQRVHEERGVVFRNGRSVVAWDGTSATLDDGTMIAGDLVVVGTGVRPRLELAKAAGLTIADDDVGGGVAVDATLRTSAPGVFALGDIASVPDPRLGRPIRVEHWVVAQRMGQWLARRLMGLVDGDYGAVPFFWTNQYDVALQYVGHVERPDDRSIDGELAERTFIETLRQDGEVRALVLSDRDEEGLRREADWDR